MMYRTLPASRMSAHAGVRRVDPALTDYFRCPDRFAAVAPARDLSADEGYFTFQGVIGFGRASGVEPVKSLTPGRVLPDASAGVAVDREGVRLPFDLSQVVRNIREERYRQAAPRLLERVTASSLVRGIYYALRPALPVSLRKHLQRARLAGWERIPFPQWPVDSTVDDMMRQVLAAELRASGARRVPFIWFWPDGAPAAAIVTHDVESQAGRTFCGALMDLDDAHGIKAAFQLIPEPRDMAGATPRDIATAALAGTMRRRGFEVNLHDLNHDGYLFQDRRQFEERAARINAHARELGCRGFRSGAMYRRQQWFDALEFAYDMSVPSAAHLEPQRGGCGTVMPYFVQGLLELPLTTIQDYSLFHILDDYSTTLWQRQIARIVSKNGLVTVLTHPDYLMEARARAVYQELLTQLARMRDEGELWLALPGDVNSWWRNRARMRLVPAGEGWRIEGPDSHRARVAYAALDDGRLVYSVGGRA